MEQREQLAGPRESMRAFGAGWLEWRWVDKPSGGSAHVFITGGAKGDGSERNTLARSVSPDSRLTVRYQLP
jgi:hypothetical protein